jgi:hypothetical protein
VYTPSFHERYYHREPVTAKTRLLGDDLIACVLSGVYTDVEKTMIEIELFLLAPEGISDADEWLEAE